MAQETSVYIHFPWCRRKCPYCDFATQPSADGDLPHEAYADRIIQELDWRSEGLEGRSLVSIFIGGGTPSLWDPKSVKRVLGAVRGAFTEVAPALETTIECNPDSLRPAKVDALLEGGVDRFSIGVQSTRDQDLSFFGRLHDGETAVTSLREVVRRAPRVSADLMFGGPGQDPESLREIIDRVLDTGIQHISAYALTIEAATRFGQLQREGRLTLATEDSYAEMFLAARERLESRGLHHYEVSNYASDGETSRHNQHYWRGGAYLGLGAAAVGCLDDAVGAARRYRNQPTPTRYLQAPDRASLEEYVERLGPEELVRESLMLGLRTLEGVDLHATEARAGAAVKHGREAAWARRLERGDLIEEDGHARVPPERWLMLDGIVADLF